MINKDNHNDNTNTNTNIDTSYSNDIKTMYLSFNLMLFYRCFGYKIFILSISTMAFQVIFYKLIFKKAYKTSPGVFYHKIS